MFNYLRKCLTVWVKTGLTTHSVQFLPLQIPNSWTSKIWTFKEFSEKLTCHLERLRKSSQSALQT